MIGEKNFDPNRVIFSTGEIVPGGTEISDCVKCK